MAGGCCCGAPGWYPNWCKLGSGPATPVGKPREKGTPAGAAFCGAALINVCTGADCEAMLLLHGKPAVTGHGWGCCCCCGCCIKPCRANGGGGGGGTSSTKGSSASKGFPPNPVKIVQVPVSLLYGAAFVFFLCGSFVGKHQALFCNSWINDTQAFNFGMKKTL